MTDPLLNGSTEVPTYTSTLSLRTVFCELRQYSCSAVVSPLSNSEYIQNGSATSQSITGCKVSLYDNINDIIIMILYRQLLY